MKIGLLGLLVSRKGSLSLLIFGCSFVAIMTNHLDGPSFAAITSTVAAIYHWTQHKLDLAAKATPNLPERGSL
jgi:hypothetical protein